ncbi:hypothetical protein F7725_021996 [Dissostichus mawsoni]|uniref:Anoctamin n=1 Tax=Dissostichus mawsoni TaxID=36200 RepID=A0A7J5ZG33_DISMA|nr:hypothetical protein F7725_021996 [Dissostichus mawsoni]
MPWDVLCTYAEVLHIKLPIQPNDLSSRPSPWRHFSCITKHFYPDEQLIMKETEFFTAPFEKDRLEYFHSRFNVKSEDEGSTSERYLLYREWAHPKSFYKMQPLNLIRKYYGEKIGIYFAWLGFYTIMLALAAVKLCIFDNFGTLVFAVFMSIWVTLFLEFWKRYQAELEYMWDTVEFLEQDEPPRPEYEAKCTHERKNPVTGILLILASIMGIIVYRLAAFFAFSAKLRAQDLKELQPLKEYVTPQMATAVTASLISFVVIMILNILYERVAIWITDFGDFF